MRTRAPSPISNMPPQKRPLSRRTTSEPTPKRPTRIPRPKQASLLDDIGKYVARDAKEVKRLGWADFVRRRRGRGDFASLADIKHPARCLLQQYKHRGSLVVLTSELLDGGRAPGGAETGTTPVRHGAHPFPTRGVCLDDRKREVGSASLLGSQGASRTSAEPAGRDSGAGSEALLARRL